MATTLIWLGTVEIKKQSSRDTERKVQRLWVAVRRVSNNQHCIHQRGREGLSKRKQGREAGRKKEASDRKVQEGPFSNDLPSTAEGERVGLKWDRKA